MLVVKLYIRFHAKAVYRMELARVDRNGLFDSHFVVVGAIFR